MRLKGYFGIVCMVLALIGISWEHTSKPNQEVVLQFNQNAISCDTAQAALTSVKLQLQGIGVQNIQVVESPSGLLKITYYSDMDVAVVKQMITAGEHLALSVSDQPIDIPLESPTQDEVPSYELNISEIKQLPLADVGTDGFIFELKSNHDRYVPPVVYAANTVVTAALQNNLDTVAYLVFSIIKPSIDTTSRTTPEVRAGPIS